MNNDNTPLSEEELVTFRILQAKNPLSKEESDLLEILKKRHMIEKFKPVNPNTNTLQLPPLFQVGTSPNRKGRVNLPPHSLLPSSTNSDSYPIIPTPPSAPNNMSLQSNPTITEFNPPADITSESLCDTIGNCFGRKNQVVPTTAGGKFTKNKRRKLRSSHKKVRAKRSKQNKRKRSSKRNKRYTRKH
jgi:hypothetical protein